MKTIIRIKVYFDRARGYISYVQTFIVGLTALKVFNVEFTAWTYIFAVIGLATIAVLIGWAESKLGVFQAEQQRISEQNPMLTKVITLLEDIQKDNIRYKKR